MLVENSTLHTLSAPHTWEILEVKGDFAHHYSVPYNAAKELNSILYGIGQEVHSVFKY